MKKIVLTFGVIAGVILSTMMSVQMAFMDQIGFDRGEIVGYTSMVLAFLLVYFGVRSYRDNVAGGSISFGRAFGVGLLISAVAAVFYVATWEVIYFKLEPDFGAKYGAYQVQKARSEGATEEAIAAKKAEMDKFAEMYKNPAVNIALTFLEPMPVALIVALVAAGVLSRKKTTLLREAALT